MLICGLALTTAACSSIEPGALPVDNWEAGYFASINVRSAPASEQDALMARSKEQTEEVVQKLHAIQQKTLNPGCIHRTIDECLASLSQLIGIEDFYPGNKNYILGKVDLDGHVMPDKAISFDGHIVGRKKDFLSEAAHHYRFLADVDPNLVVSKLEISLPADPMAAHGAEDYYATGAFEVIAAIKPSDCVLNRTDFYRNFENNLKPKVTSSSGADSTGSRQRWIESKTPTETICGMQIEFSGAYGRDSDLKTSFNAHGVYGGGWLMVH
jgi:hypothetical protein